MRLSLAELGALFNTDKAAHGYLAEYEPRLDPVRDSATAVLELGVDRGQSLKLWANYFPSARIVGVDLFKIAPLRGRIRLEQCDAADFMRLNAIARKHGPFDLVVDDGSHQTIHHGISFAALWSHLKPGGWYAIEDCDVSPDTPLIWKRAGGEVLVDGTLVMMQKRQDQAALRPLARKRVRELVAELILPGTRMEAINA